MVRIWNDFASAIALMACRITNTASEIDTAESLYVWTNSAGRITSTDTPQHALRAKAAAADASLVSDAPVDYQNSEALFELRLLTEFTWDQIARLFSVSRRTVHLWAGGGPMSRENEEHLHRMLGIIRRADRGRTGDNRAALLSATNPVRKCAFDLLAARDYEDALMALQPSEPSQERTPRFAPSAELLAERAPLPLDVLLSGRTDDLPKAVKHGRRVRYRKATRNS